MEADMINPSDLSCIAFLNKKRKLQDELLSLPLPKHVCWGKKHGCSFPDLTTEPKMVRGNIFVRGVESEPESASISYTFLGDTDMSMSSHDDATKAHASAEATVSSTFSDDASSQIGLYSESISLMRASSICEELHCLYREYGLKLPDNYEDHLLEFGNHGDCSLSGSQIDVMEGCVVEGVDNQLYSNGVEGSNYVLSSGRWSANQDNQEGTKKLTIDKEFEQYFSALML